MAAEEGNVQVARFLIAHGAHADISNTKNLGSLDLGTFIHWFDKNRTSGSEAMEMVGLLLSAGCGSDITSSKGYLDISAYPVPGSVINILLNHSSSVTDELWIQEHIHSCLRKLLMPIDAQVHIMAEEFQAIMFQFNLSVGMIQQNGHSLLHKFFDWHRSTSLDFQATQFKKLLQCGWSPYSLDYDGCTLTLRAIWYDILPIWFSALREVNQDVDAIAVHCLSNYPSQLRKRGGFLDWKIRNNYGSLEAFRGIILSEFAKNGCYITDPRDVSNTTHPEPEISATGIQYSAPSHEAEDMGVRRRKVVAGRVEEIED